MSITLSIYLAALIMGGVFVGLSVFSGLSKDFEVDKEADFDADADADFDADADADFDADADADFEVDKDLSIDKSLPVDKDLDTGRGKRYRPLKSFKFWTFFLAFFGLTGTIFTLLSLWANAIGVAALSAFMGLFAGLLISYLIYVGDRSTAGRVIGQDDFRNLEGKVVLPFGQGRRGKVQVRLQGRLIELEAVMFERDEEVVFNFDDECIILEVDNGVAQVVPAASMEQQAQKR